ncbi:unnamed protein product [Prorocentrum cordatum]|uniref:Uncharacterized protein n=1 Tax=Prorocentrum cordatum TaxID=2364126 RepID=A0ABN9UDS2_9DINO|nr:unnamed protein product [Polarella glacialis]
MGGSRMAARREGAGTLEGNPLTGRRQRDRTLLGGVGHRAPIGDEWAMGRGGGGGGGGEQERSEHLEASQVWLEQAEAQRSHRTSDASPTMPPTPARQEQAPDRADAWLDVPAVSALALAARRRHGAFGSGRALVRCSRLQHARCSAAATGALRPGESTAYGSAKLPTLLRPRRRGR